MSQEKTLVVILCMHRCGSSLVARLLQRLGMSLGPFDLGESNASNKYGHFEAQPFVLLNREFQLRQFGYEGDLPDDAQNLRHYCERDGRWTSEEAISAEAIARGRDRVVQLMQSGAVCGFKDPRTVQVWPYWRRVWASLPGLRIVPLFLVRGPHEIAMSIFRRSQGDRDYAQALDVTAVHFRRMKEIYDEWSGPRCVVQFDPQVCGLQLQRAAELCGLNWSDAAFAEVYDASCRHHEAAVIDHPAQAAFESLTGLASSPPRIEDYRRLLADAAMREATLRQECDTARREVAQRRQEVAALEHVNACLRPIAAQVPPLEARLAQTTYDFSLIRNSRTWRAHEALVQVLGFARRGNAGQDTHSKPRPDGQDAQSLPTGLHYCEREDHAGN